MSLLNFHILFLLFQYVLKNHMKSILLFAENCDSFSALGLSPFKGVNSRASHRKMVISKIIVISSLFPGVLVKWQVLGLHCVVLGSSPSGGPVEPNH